MPTPQLDQQLAASVQAQSVSNAGGLSFEPLVGAGGPPRVVSLLDLAASTVSPSQPPRTELPLLLYLPGIDGTGLAASRQFPSLQRSFDLRVLVTPVDDRTPFDRLVSLVADFLAEEVPSSPPERPCYVLGESFGGVLALAVAAACPGLVDRLGGSRAGLGRDAAHSLPASNARSKHSRIQLMLHTTLRLPTPHSISAVLVNPATSFPRTVWPLLGPAIAGVPEQVYGALPLALAPVLGNPVGLLAAGLDDADAASGSGGSTENEGGGGGGGGLLQQRAAALAATAVNLLTQLPALAKVLPPDTLAWKVELLQQGCAAVDELALAAVPQRTLILAAGADLLIPSEEEGKRLRRALPRATLRVLPGRSHALLQEVRRAGGAASVEALVWRPTVWLWGKGRGKVQVQGATFRLQLPAATAVLGRAGSTWRP